MASFLMTMGQKDLGMRPYPCHGCGCLPGARDPCWGSHVPGLVFLFANLGEKVLERFWKLLCASHGLHKFVSGSLKLLGVFFVTHRDNGGDCLLHCFPQLRTAGPFPPPGLAPGSHSGLPVQRPPSSLAD